MTRRAKEYIEHKTDQAWRLGGAKRINARRHTTPARPRDRVMVDAVTNGSTNRLRLERAALLARHDSGAIAPAVLAIIRQLETEIAWREHAKYHRLACERE